MDDTMEFSVYSAQDSGADCFETNMLFIYIQCQRLQSEETRASKYLGTWYEIKWIESINVPVSEAYQNYKHTYAMQSEDDLVGAVSARNSSETCLYYKVFLKSTNTTGKYEMSSSVSDGVSPYWIIETDYTQYSLVYGCSKLNVNGTCDSARVWIWSRKTSLSSSLIETATNKMSDLCVDSADLIDTRHNKDCPPETSNAVNLLSCFTLIIFAVIATMYTSCN